MIRNILGCLLVLGGLSLANYAIPPEVVSTQPTTLPATVPATQAAKTLEVKNEKSSVQFSFWQEDKEIKPDNTGIIHLKARPFAIHFSGDAAHTALLTRSTPDIAGQLDKIKGQIVSIVGMGAAHDGKTLLIETESELKNWDNFAAVFDEASKKNYEKNLLNELHEKPHVLESGLQYMSCEDTDKTYILQVDKLYNVEWQNAPSFNITFFLTHKVCENFCVTLKWLNVQVKLEK